MQSSVSSSEPMPLAHGEDIQEGALTGATPDEDVKTSPVEENASENVSSYNQYFTYNECDDTYSNTADQYWNYDTQSYDCDYGCDFSCDYGCD